MRRSILLLCFLFASVMAFSVSGRVFMHFGSYNDPDSTNIVIGPMFSFWGVENNVDLWQGKDGTGFEVNFDSFSIVYKTREALTIANWLDTSDYNSSQKWGTSYANAKATSPGYIRFQNIKLGNAYLAAGLGLWTLLGTKSRFETNVSASTNFDYTGNVGYLKGYMDFKVDIPISENITIKMYDWDLMWLEFFTGTSTLKGNVNGSTYTTNSGAAGGFKVYVPLHLLLNLDQFQLDFSPRAVFDNNVSNYVDPATTNSYGEIYYKFGAYMKMTYNFDRVFALYGMFGYFNEYDLIRVRSASGVGVHDLKYTANIIPLYAGLKIAITPNIVFNIGYGANLMLNNTWQYLNNGVISTVETGMQLRTGYLNNWVSNSFVNMAVPAERSTYGDTLMDASFLKFGATIKIINNWEMGMQAAVSLNDAWTREYLNDASVSYTYVNPVGNSGNKQDYNWLSFLNWMNYDNNMYLKFETDTFVAKMTFDMWSRRSTQVATIAGLFGYLDFTYKF